MPRRRSRRTQSASDLKQVAWSQKVLIVCLLGHLALWLWCIASMIGGRDANGEQTDLFSLVLILSVLWGIFSGVFNCLVEVKLSGAVVGVLVAILSAFPCLGLFLILIVNTRATSALQANGVRVGFLGARISDIADLPDEFDDEDDEDDEDDRSRGRRRNSKYDVDEREGW